MRYYYRYKRYCLYLVEYFFERMRGLDFTMRDLTLIEKTEGRLRGYSKTDERHARKIFDSLEVDNNKRILDVGCGKGSFLKVACEYPFGAIEGIEYSEELANVAVSNMRRLKLDDRVKIYQGDATQFDGYGNYNVFYFFNPFDREIMNLVLDRIVSECEDEFWIVLHHPVCSEDVVAHGLHEVARLFDKMKQYETVVYKWDGV